VTAHQKKLIERNAKANGHAPDAMRQTSIGQFAGTDVTIYPPEQP